MALNSDVTELDISQPIADTNGIASEYFESQWYELVQELNELRRLKALYDSTNA